MDIGHDEIRMIVQEELKAIKPAPRATARKSSASQKKIKMQFSKKLTLFISGVWLFLLAFCLIFWVISREYPNEIFNAVTVPFVTILTSYFVKSGYENKTKIEGGTEGECDVY